MTRSQDEYQSRLDAASSARRHDPLRDAAHHAVSVWMSEDEYEKNDLSDEFWRAMADLAGVLVEKKRGEPEDVPQVEVTYDGSPLPVVVPERPLEGRRSGAKNVSAPEYQNAFISEARAAMGQPSPDGARTYINQKVTLHFNVDWEPVTGVLTDVVSHPSAAPFLVLDNLRGRAWPLHAVERIEVVS